MLIIGTVSASASAEGKWKRVERSEELEAALVQIQRRCIAE